MVSQNDDGTFERSWSYVKGESLTDLQRLGILYSWLSVGEVDLQIWSGNKKVVASTISVDVDKNNFVTWKLFADVMTTLVELAGTASDDIRLTVG